MPDNQLQLCSSLQEDWSVDESLDEVVAYINKTSPQNARLVLSDTLSTAAADGSR